MKSRTTTYQRKMWWLIGITAITKILLSHFIELGNDEVYYYTYAIQPDWNHFDHPGMVGWIIRITSLNLNWVSALSMRLGSILCAAGATWIIFKTGTLLKDEYTGYIAAWMYTFSIYTSIIAGFFILPDSPQLLFFTLSIYWMVKWVTIPAHFKTKDWILLGFLIGLATLSKIHGLYLWVGFGAFLLFHQSKTLGKKSLYLAILVTIICVIPILYWNVQNDFVTYQYHSKRVMHTGLLIDSFLQQVGGEFLYQNPLIYISILIALFNLGHIINNKTIPLLLWLSLPLIGTFWIIALFNPTLPHWSGPGFIGLFLIAGIYWSERGLKHKLSFSMPLLIKAAAGLLLFFLIGFLMFVYIYPKQIGSTKSENLGEYNPINDVTGWEECKKAMTKIVTRDQQLSLMSVDAPLISHKWFPAAHLLFYVAQPLQKKLVTIGNLESIHKFAWINKTQQGLKIGEDAYCIVPSNIPSNPSLLYGAYFESIQCTDTIPIVKKGVLLRNFYVYRLMKCKKVPNDLL